MLVALAAHDAKEIALAAAEAGKRFLLAAFVSVATVAHAEVQGFR